MNDIMKIVQALEDFNILEEKGGFLSTLLGTLGASLLGNMLAGKGIVRADSGNKKGKGIVRAAYGKECDF